MSSEAFEQFRGLVASDALLRQQCLQLMAECDVPKLLALARARGFAFTAEEAASVLEGAELSDMELEMVAGGSAGHKGGPGCTCSQCRDPRTGLPG